MPTGPQDQPGQEEPADKDGDDDKKPAENNDETGKNAEIPKTGQKSATVYFVIAIAMALCIIFSLRYRFAKA